MRLRGLGKVRQIAGRIRERFGPRSVILLYHRVIETVSDPYLLCVTPQLFEEHLRVIREFCAPVRLGELARAVRDGHLPERAVCVTFDDGYQDNLYTAKPLLERYEVPATFFMTTGAIGREREFWWDELERVFLQPGCRPDRLQLEVAGQRFEWNLGEAASYGERELHRDRAWTMVNTSDPTPRHAAFRAVYQLVQPMEEVHRRQVLDSLLGWASLPLSVRPTHRALEPAEVADLERGGLMEIGAHTVTHPDLSAQPAAIQRAEIQQSKADLQAWLGHPVESFAYPYGYYSAESVAAVREAGFEYACACLSRTVRRRSELLLLPRVDVGNWSGGEFASHLKRWLAM
jgi:peptidoglycan/xylan/chitin deacetylase (PgdA/CDA1 family)